VPAVHDGGGSPRPDWLTRTDTSGANDLFTMLGDNGTGVRVEPDQLKSFSADTSAQAAAFQTGYSNGVASLFEPAYQIGGSTTEASAFLSKHGYVMQQMQMLAQDVGIGLAALGQGAQTIALNYLDSDATQSATMNEVNGAFAPQGNADSLRHGMTEAAAQATQADQDVVDGMVAALPAPDDMTPDADAADAPVDPRASETPIALGDSGDTYTIPADDDIETTDSDDLYRADARRMQDDGDHYDPAEE